jgi:general secretion pathway protein K
MNHQVMKPKPSERGAALLVVLLLVVAMAALASTALEDIRFAVRRTANVESMGQAQWYALGAETLAKARLQQVLSRSGGQVALEGGWSGAPVVYPIENGAIRMRLTDRGGCFNLNSVVSGEPESYAPNPTGVAQFQQLLIALEVPEVEALGLADALVDWIDSDNTRRPFGAEDEAYERRPTPYRTAGHLLAEETELRAIQGFTPDIYRRIRPSVCALPIPQLTELNINTLAPSDAPVLSAAYLGRLPVDAARRIIAGRPAKGWATQAAFLEEPLLEESVREGGAPPLQQLGSRTRFFALDGTVEFAGAVQSYALLLEAHPSGALQTAVRRWAPLE